MRNIWCFLLALVTISASNPCYAYRPTLEVTPTSGYAPLTVNLEVPRGFLTRAHSAAVSKWGRTHAGMSWGDGTGWDATNSGEDFSGRHTYETPGTYTITMGWGGPGPTDAPVGYSGSTTVTVYALPVAIQITSPTMEDTFSYRQFPTVQWSLVTDRKVNVRMQLLDDQQNLISEGVIKGIAQNVSNQTTLMHPRTFAAYDAALQRGDRRFRARIEAIDDTGRAVYSATSQAFTMLPKSESNSR